MSQNEYENRRIGVEGLRQQIDQWDIKYRIQEKISIWGIGYTSRKIDKIPQEFIVEAFLYYILKTHPQLILNYKQPLLLDSLFALKKIYSGYSIQYFKENQNFNFSLVVLSKLLRYFLFSNYPHLKLPENLEAHIFASITFAIIGYPIDLTAYTVIEQKMKQKKKDKIDRASRSLDQNLQKDLRRTVDRKIRRWGVKDRLVHGHQNKQLQHFRLQVQQSLRTKATPLKKQQPEKPKLRNLYSSDSCYLGFEQPPEISFHQISAAMMANKGFSSPKCSPKLQLSKLNKTKQHITHFSQIVSSKSKENSVSFESNVQKAKEQGQKCAFISKISFQKAVGKKLSKKDGEQTSSSGSILLTLENRLSQDFYSKLRKRIADENTNMGKKKHFKSGDQLWLPKINKE